MAWKIELERPAERSLAKSSPQAAKRIAAKLREIAAASGNPRGRGKAMSGQLSGHWRYRIGHYRVIARIEDERLVIIIIAVGHRREVYW